MKKKKKMLLILSALLIIGIAAYIILSGTGADEAGEIIVKETKPEELQSIVLKTKGNTFTFVKEGGEWAYREDKTFPLNPAYTESLEKGVSQVKADRIIAENRLNEKEYGLDEPQSTVTAETRGGERFHIYIGDQNPVTSYYYICCDGDERIYSVSSTYAERFCRSILDMASLEVANGELNIADVRSINAECGEEKFSLQYLEDSSGVFYDKNVHWFVNEGGEYSASSERTAKELKDRLTTLSFEKCAAYRPTEEEIVQYGIDTPRASLEMRFLLDGSEEVMKIVIGKEITEENGEGDEKRFTYVYNVRRDAVYLDKSEDIAELLKLSADGMKSLQVCSAEFADLKSAAFKTADVTHTVEIKHSEKKGKAAYVLNGWATEDERIWRILYDVTSMEADMLAAKDDVFFDVPTVGDLTVWLEKRDGTKIKVEYYNYDENFYLATVNGSGRFLVNRKYVEALMESIKAL